MPTTTIGVFDSGFGGLTVLRALLPRIPGAHYIYLGDTARLPYGAKSQTTIARYAVESALFLAAQGCDLLVIACNTATALALPEIRAAVPIPVIGVIEPGANAVLASLPPLTDVPARPPTDASSQSDVSYRPPTDASSQPDVSYRPPTDVSSQPDVPSSPPIDVSSRPERSEVERPLYFASPANPLSSPQQPAPQVLVLATAATVHSHAYRDACAALNLNATEKACPLLVPLVEEGWIDHPVTRDVLRIYIAEALATCKPSAVLLGCTHYPLIASAISQTLRDLGSTATVIDSADATAQAVAATMEKELVILTLSLPKRKNPLHPATFTCYATDSIEKFQRLGSHFLGQTIPQVHLLDLGG